MAGTAYDNRWSDPKYQAFAQMRKQSDAFNAAQGQDISKGAFSDSYSDFATFGGGGAGSPIAESSTPAAGGTGAGVAPSTDPLQAALSGLRSAQAPAAAADPTQGFTETAAPGAADPNLGSRLMPIMMAQLSQMGRRIY